MIVKTQVSVIYHLHLGLLVKICSYKIHIQALFNVFYVRTSGGNVVIKGPGVLCLFVRDSSCKTHVGNFIVY